MTELYKLLQKQRMLVDESAIYFISTGDTTKGKKADARNSIFKLAQKFKALPDSENVANIKRMFGNVGNEDDSSEDDEWEPSYKKIPEILKERALNKISVVNSESKLKSDLISEMDSIEEEANALIEKGNVTSDEISEELSIKSIASCYFGGDESVPRAASKENNYEDDDDDDVDLSEDLRRLNTLQTEFLGNNLHEWYNNISATYTTGVKLVKVNAMGKKFIRLVRIKDLNLYITQAHSNSIANVDRCVSILNIVKVAIGIESKEFTALAKRIEDGIEPPEHMPQSTLCAVVLLPDNRSVSLIFLKEDQRNGFVFYMRVLIRRAINA